MRVPTMALVCILWSLSFADASFAAQSESSAESLAGIQAVLAQTQKEKQALEEKLAALNREYLELQKIANNTACLPIPPRDKPDDTNKINDLNKDMNKSPENSVAVKPQDEQKSCKDLIDQNNSLRDTIRAQNAYLLNVDNSTQISQKLVDENNTLKSKSYYLEQATKSSAEEIKRLMMMTEGLNKQLNQCRAAQ